jgi:glucose/arabinose dehydrogenase
VISGSAMYVNIGSPSNVCQIANRALHSLGRNPCPELATRAGVWQFDATMMNQGLAKGTRIGTGMRNTNAMAMDPSSGTAAGAAGGTLWGAINGRDQLNEDWPEMFSAEQDKQLPADEVVAITPGTDRGWPYCYADPAAKQMKLAPEYGGNGTVQGGCAAIPMPPISLAAHSAPLGMTFVTGTQFPEAFRGGVLISNHGTRFDANATGDLHGYDVEFVPFANGQPSGDIQKFATGFDAGARPLPDAAPHRPVGLAMMPDGSLLIGDDQGGRIWRVFYNP